MSFISYDVITQKREEMEKIPLCPLSWNTIGATKSILMHCILEKCAFYVANDCAVRKICLELLMRNLPKLG